MAYSFYDASILMAKGSLTSLKQMLVEAEKHTNSDTFFNACLIDDMKPLTFQVHYAAFSAQALAAKLSHQDYDEPSEQLDTYEKMHARVDQALTTLAEADKNTVNQVCEEITSFRRRDETLEVPVKGVVGLVHMPNIYFHVSMAYAILRKEGVPLGKRHWSRGFVGDYVRG